MNISIDFYLKIGFECDSDDYTVYLFYENLVDWSSSNLDCKVYHSNEGVWKSNEERFFTGSRKLRFDMPVPHRGAVHFISDCCFPFLNKNNPYFRPYIISYNFEDGESRMLRVPKEATRVSHDSIYDMGVFKWGKAKPYVWIRVLKIRVKAMGLVEEDPMIRVKGFVVLNDLLVFATEEKIYGYGLIDMRIQEICDHECEYNVLCFTSYKDTLHTCGTGAETLPLPLCTCGTGAGTLSLPSYKQ
ncbi:hypothetical protein JHK85_001850 [Glycine max]|nr:hypothetical protein JHK85_001850 [Glycine max]KAG5089186.1 hypothetical protein JHK86_001798 [Glycine max]